MNRAFARGANRNAHAGAFADDAKCRALENVQPAFAGSAGNAWLEPRHDVATYFFLGCSGASPLSAARTLSTWPSTFTGDQTAAILPSSPMRYVERIVPCTFL